MVVPIIVCGREKRWSTPAACASEAKGESFLLSSAFADAADACLVAADRELASAAALALAAADDRFFAFSSEATITAASSSSSSLARATKEAAEEAWRCE